ncbi:DUF6802 family protein [Corynebacterium caspium]|uniref:DUF6802 family protein n=1 Tax=Corynebacterium caspium TaxID=234828 RepID=UPI00037E006D|nr:DUF6802 family protein [Corynebacterium caspium]WKD59963.1 hypothetical protein CCASP_07940 [Corynebacterium caspium DSM 44850]
MDIFDFPAELNVTYQEDLAEGLAEGFAEDFPEGFAENDSVTVMHGETMAIISDLDGDGIADHLTRIDADGHAATWMRTVGGLINWVDGGITTPEKGCQAIGLPSGWHIV